MAPNHATRRRGRPAGITPECLRKRYIIAAAVIQGIKIAHVAAVLGVWRPLASREANSPGVRNIFATPFSGDMIAVLQRLRANRHG